MALFPRSANYRPVNPVLGGLIQGLGNSEETFIGRQALPVFHNGSSTEEGGEAYSSGQIMRLGLGALFGDPLADFIRAPGAEYHQSKGAMLDAVDYCCQQYASAATIPQEAEARAQLGDLTLHEIQLAAAIVSVRIREERDISTLFSTPANWADTVTLVGPTKWSTATGDPSGDLRNAANTVFRYGVPWGGLTAVMGVTAFNTLCENSAWNEWGPANTDRTTMTEGETAAKLRDKYGIGKTYVGRAHYNTSANPAVLNLSPIWPDFVWVGALDPRGQVLDKGGVAVGMTAAARVVEADYEVREYHDPKINSIVLPFAFSQWTGVVRQQLGTMIIDCT